jgi:predicted enzyme related to lactoylglutathione lyase
MGNPVVYSEISSTDYKKLESFYSDIFDWRMTPFGDQPYTSIDPGEGPTGGIGANPEGYPGRVTFYVAVDDPAKTLEQIEAKGGKTVAPLMEIPNGPTIAVFADPAGNKIGLRKA